MQAFPNADDGGFFSAASSLLSGRAVSCTAASSLLSGRAVLRRCSCTSAPSACDRCPRNHPNRSNIRRSPTSFPPIRWARRDRRRCSCTSAGPRGLSRRPVSLLRLVLRGLHSSAPPHRDRCPNRKASTSLPPFPWARRDRGRGDHTWRRQIEADERRGANGARVRLLNRDNASAKWLAQKLTPRQSFRMVLRVGAKEQCFGAA